MSLTLRILDGTGAEHVLTDDSGRLGTSIQYTEEIDRGEVRLGHIRLTLSQGGRLMGAARREDLPPPSVHVGAEPDGEVGMGQGGYRAVLTRTTPGGEAETVLDGVIPRLEIAYDETPGVWDLLLMPSQEDLWARLAAVHLDDLPEAVHAALSYVEMPYIFLARDFFGGTASRRYFLSTAAPNGIPVREDPYYRWYDLIRLCERVIEAAGDVSLVGSIPEPTFSVSYITEEGQGVVRTITRSHRPYVFSLGSYVGGAFTRTNLTLPAWTGKDLFERVSATFGWRLHARYAPYPSTVITVDVAAEGGPLPAPEALARLDERKGDGGYTRRAEPGTTGGVAIRHANSLREATPSVQMPSVYRPGTPTGHGTLPAPVPAVAVLAQTRWAFKAERPGARSEQEPQPVAETVHDTGFRLPMLGHPAAEGVQLPAQNVTPNATAHPDYLEQQIYGVPVLEHDLEAAYLGVPLPTHHGPGLLWALRPGFPAPGQHGLVNQVWARELYALRSRALQPVELADGAFYTQGLDLAVGVEARGASLEGRAWLVRARTVDVETDEAHLLLGRPEPDEAVPAALPGRVGAVQDLEARFEASLEGSSIHQRLVILTWRPPEALHGSYRRYDVQWREAGRTLPSGEPAWNGVTAYATAHLFDVEAGKTYEYRVRAVGDTRPDGSTAPDVGPWEEGQITADSPANG